MLRFHLGTDMILFTFIAIPFGCHSIFSPYIPLFFIVPCFSFWIFLWVGPFIDPTHGTLLSLSKTLCRFGDEDEEQDYNRQSDYDTYYLADEHVLCG